MNTIQRFGSSSLWSDVVVHQNVAYWVEVAEDRKLDARGQIEQVLAQIDVTLAQLGSARTDLLQVLIYLADLVDAPTLNEVWRAWVPPGHAPIRACVQAGLSSGYRVEMVITAAVASPTGGTRAGVV